MWLVSWIFSKEDTKSNESDTHALKNIEKALDTAEEQKMQINLMSDVKNLTGKNVDTRENQSCEDLLGLKTCLSHDEINKAQNSLDFLNIRESENVDTSNNSGFEGIIDTQTEIKDKNLNFANEEGISVGKHQKFTEPISPNSEHTIKDICMVKNKKSSLSQIQTKAPQDDKKDPLTQNEKVESPSKTTTDIKIIKIFEPVCDTSQSYIIQKFLIKDTALIELKQNLPPEILLIGIYGISSIMKKFLCLTFEEEICYMPKKEGIHLFFNAKKAIGVFAYITPYEQEYIKGPIKSSSKLVVNVRILSDLCKKIIACISDEIIDGWFYEKDGSINPFLPKIHPTGKAILKNVIIQEPRLDEIIVEGNLDVAKKYFLPKDNSDLLFSYDYKEVSQNDNEKSFNILREFPKKLIFLKDINDLNAKINELFSDLKLRSIDSSIITESLKTKLQEYFDNKFKLVDSYSLVPMYAIKDRFYFKSDYPEKEIKFAIATALSNRFSEKEIKFSQAADYSNRISEKLLKDLTKEIKKKTESYGKSFIAKIVEKHFPVYVAEGFSTFKSKDMVSNIVNDISKEFQVEKQKKSLLIFNTTLEQKLNELAKNLVQVEKMPIIKFIDYIEKEICSLIIDPKSQEIKILLKNTVSEFFNQLKDLEKIFIEGCLAVLKNLEYLFSGKMLNLKKSVLKLSEKEINKASSLVCSIEDSKYELNRFINSESIEVKQIIGIGPSVYFVLVADLEKKITYVHRFNPINNERGGYEKCEDILDSDVHIAWGSYEKNCIIFQNNNKLAIQGSLKNNKFLPNTLNLDIYNKIPLVKTSYYMKNSNKLYVLDNDGQLYCKELVNTNCDIYFVTSPTRNSESENYKPLRSVEGEKFLNIEVSSDESIIFLQTKVNIECYDKNFYLTNQIKVTTNFISLKSIIKDNKCFLFVLNSDSGMKCYNVVTPKQETFVDNSQTKEITRIVPGNPVFDIHHLGIMKFGPIVEETQFIKGSRYIGYYSFCKKLPKIKTYLKGLKLLKSSFKLINFVDPNDCFTKIEPVKIDKLLFTISTRLPIHIASIQNGNLIPLQNGLNNFEIFTKSLGNKSFFDNFQTYIKFGNYEEILENLKGMMVISIIGKQSSGKSYLLNRLVGTKFDVAAERCTDGLWMGIGTINDTPIVVFDCEGLFTIERSTQEEIKLCLFISSLSDLIILNSDLSSSKHIKGLFDEFASGVDRLKGKNLFKGSLDITYRDIPNNQVDGANTEFNRFLNSLIETGKKESLAKLFNDNISNSLYHNFEKKLFDNEVSNKRNEYINSIHKKWSNEPNFGMIIKMILAQIFSDDATNVDIRIFSAQNTQLKKIVNEMITNPNQARKYLNTDVYKGIILLESFSFEIEWAINEFYIDELDPLKFFKISLFSEKKDLIKKHHKDFYIKLDENIRIFLDKRKDLIINYFKDKLPQSEVYKEQIESDVIDIEAKIEKRSNSLSLCLKICEKCEFVCVKHLKHKDACSCETNHICEEICSKCGGNSVCCLNNGHKREHFCNKSAHKCTGTCNLKNCKKDCGYDPGHEGLCQCLSSRHPCRENCKMFEECGNLCDFDITIDHDEHSCGKDCPFKCIFKDGQNCSSYDHFHDSSLNVENVENYGECKRHLCSKNHNCISFCILPGVCNVTYNSTYKTYRNNHNNFIYLYTEVNQEKLTCKLKITPGNIKHDKSHECIKQVHTCLERCPECNCFCEKPYGHGGLHESKIHRNKDCSEYISLTETFTMDIKENEKNENRTVTFVAGESASPEFCDRYCITKGRGHTHPVACEGGELCMGKAYPDLAIHSIQEYKSSCEKLIYYDFLTCDTYWKKFGWVPPNQKTPEVQEIFGKCNCVCNHPSHEKEHVEVYCEGKLFHSMSLNYSDHFFNCTHPRCDLYDIVFIVDCTGSMRSYIPLVKELIKNLIIQWGEKINKFAFVGYTDHDDSGNMNSKCPVDVFPKSGILADGNGVCVIEHIKTIVTCGGGDNGGEAMIDGLDAASNLTFQAGSSRIFILIADDTPHGKEFNKMSIYPNGCPCSNNWKVILEKIRENDSEFIFVKLNSILDDTTLLFRKFYGPKMDIMSLREAEKIQKKLFETVSRKIETNYVYSSKLKVVN